MIYEKCRDILVRECELVQETVVIQEKIRFAVINREWTDFEDHLKSMNIIENKLVGLEQEREEIFSVFDSLVRKNTTDVSDAGNRFYSIVSHLPDNQRNELTTIYRSLKLESLKLRLANESVMTYLDGLKSTFKEIFDIAFPDRAGKMYSPQGVHLSQDMRSMVVNQSF